MAEEAAVDSRAPTGVATGWRDPTTWAVAVAGLVVAAVTVWVNRGLPGPQIFGDELVYVHFARQLRSFDYLPVPALPQFSATYVTPGYPALLAPFVSGGFAYGTLLAVNAVAISAAGVPVYLLARRYLRRGVAVVVAVIAMVWPGHWVYSQLVMSENLYLPVFFVLLLLVDTYFRHPTRRRILLVGAAVGVAFMVRQISVGLLPAFAVVIPVHAFLRATGPSTWDRVRRTAGPVLVHGLLLGLGFVLVLLPWVVFGLRAGRLPEALGLVNTEQRSPVPLWNLVLYGGYYLAYFAVVAAPVLVPLLMHLRRAGWARTWGRLHGLWAASAVATIGLLLPTVRHSYLVYADLSRLHGRYVTYLIILVVIVGLATLQQVRSEGATAPSWLVAALAVPLVLLFGQVLVRRGFLSIVNTPTAHPLLVELGPSWAAGAALLAAAVAVVLARTRPEAVVAGVGGVALVAFALSSAAMVVGDPLEPRHHTAHALAVVDAVRSGTVTHPSRLYFDVGGASSRRAGARLEQGIQFWGLDPVHVVVREQHDEPAQGEGLALTQRPADDEEVVTGYRSGDAQWYLVRVDDPPGWARPADG